MLKIGVSILVLALMSASCKEEEQIPSCIENLIEEIKTEEVWDPPAKIYQYQYGEAQVYFVPQRCCDIPSTLYNKSCEVICSPDGGITGMGDGKCPDFFEKRSNKRLIWEDDRN